MSNTTLLKDVWRKMQRAQNCTGEKFIWNEGYLLNCLEILKINKQLLFAKHDSNIFYIWLPDMETENYVTILYTSLVNTEHLCRICANEIHTTFRFNSSLLFIRHNLALLSRQSPISKSVINFVKV